MLKRLSIAVACLLLIGAGAAAFAWQELLARIETPHPGIAAAGVFVEIAPGDSVSAIASRLVAAGIVADEWTFRFAARRSGRGRYLQAGEYFFSAPVSPLDAVAKIADGRVHLRPITFPEGLTLPEMAAIVEAKGLGSAEAFAIAASRTALIADLDPEATDLEGYLFPETYSLPRDATVDDLVAAMVAQFRAVFDDGLRARAAERGLSVREAVTLASVIQRETGSGAEHALVSAVLQQPAPDRHAASERPHRHLRPRAGRRVRRQPDARQHAGRLAVQHLPLRWAAAGSDRGARPRTCCRRRWTRPTPPTLYFVSRNDGTHAFANTLREHNRNVREFQVEYFRRRTGR